MKEHFINQFNTFICGWYINAYLCDALIDHHRDNPNNWPGQSGQKAQVNKHIKDSIDCKIDDPFLYRKYNEELQKCVDLYVEKYPYCDRGDAWKNIELGNLQYYAPTKGYHAWHAERAVFGQPMGSRHLVYLTYLNDVTDQGETEFYHQKIKIKPEKGLTIIWPADWTFTHRGIASPTQDKYIFTGWFNYVPREELNNDTS